MTQATVFEDRFVLKQRLFSEGNQAAYAAHDRVRETSVLLFLVPPAAKLTPEMDRAVRADIERAFSVAAPSLLPVHDLREMGEYRFLVMPRPRGNNAWSLITQRKPGAKGLTPEQVLRAADDLIEAAKAAHGEGTILGCSPKQVWIDAEGGAEVQYYWLERVYLGGDDQAPAPAGGFQTLGVEGGYFRAPELERGREGAAPPADQFFIAAVLHGLLTGEVPSGTLAPIHRSRKDVPRAMAAAIEKGLAPDPSARHRDLDGMRRALHRAPAKIAGLVPLLLLLLGLWAGWALFQGGADADDFALSGEIASRRAAAFARSRPKAREVPAPDKEALARFPGRYADAADDAKHVLELRGDGAFLASDFTKDVAQHVRGLWWPDGDDADGAVLRPVLSGKHRPEPWNARASDGVLVLRPDRGDPVTLTKVGWVTDIAAGTTTPLLHLDAPLVGTLLADVDVQVKGHVAVPKTRVTVNGEKAPVVGTTFDKPVDAPKGGSFEVVVEATAPDGFVSRITRSVRIDREPPQVEATATLQQVEGIWRLEVAGRAADDEQLAAVSVNDEDVTFDAEGRFAREIPGTSATAHAFAEVVAVDAVGRVTRRLLWPSVRATNRATLDAQFKEVAAALESDETNEADRLLREIRKAGGLIEELAPEKLESLARGDRPPSISLDDLPEYFVDTDGTREITLTGMVDSAAPNDKVRVLGSEFPVEDDGRFTAKVPLPKLGPNPVPIQVERKGKPVGARREVEVRLAAGDGDVRAWTDVDVSEQQRETSAKYGLEIGLENKRGMRFVLVPPGGDLTKPYYMQVGEVTRQHFARFNKRALPKAYEAKSGNLKLDVRDGPATDMTHGEAVTFARKLSEAEGGVYRLPTDAEWEHAARAGDESSDTYWQSDPGRVKAIANLADRSIKSVATGWPASKLAAHNDGAPGTWAVRTGQANRWGLRDMLGNAAEWVVEEGGGAAAGDRRIHRGGSFRRRVQEIRFGARWSLRLSEKAADVGFRLVLEAEGR